jgi:hypothetical protein
MNSATPRHLFAAGDPPPRSRGPHCVYNSLQIPEIWSKNQALKPRPPRPTPQATIEAIMFCVRERGISALKEPDNIARLRRCDGAARAQINNRIARLLQDRAHG